MSQQSFFQFTLLRTHLESSQSLKTSKHLVMKKLFHKIFVKFNDTAEMGINDQMKKVIQSLLFCQSAKADSKSFHEPSLKSVKIDMIGTFW